MNTKMDVKVIICTLEELLRSNIEYIPNTNIKGQLTIPEYQRPYIWKEKQINQLLDSIIEHKTTKITNNPMYYLGSIILHEDDGCLKIIDGQQRITTSILLQKLINPNIKTGVQYTSGISIDNINHNLSYLKSIKEQDIFEYRELDIIDYLDFKEINVTLIITSTEDLAYTFFETQNTGGVRLEGSDILKAHHLRAISCKKNINYQARRWEAIDSGKVEYVVQLLTKMRFWDNRKWKQFPFYRDKEGIKNAIIDEYTFRTNNKEDVSYYYSAVKNEDGRLLQMHESSYKQLKQPLANGNNTLDFISDYINLQEILFGKVNDYKIDDAFYEFRDKLLHGYDGTLFLKELFEMAIIAYVSRFGFHRLFEASLWLYRMIYSLRVYHARNVREDSVFKFVYEKQFIDNILEVYTPDELFLYLKKFSYTLNTENLEHSTNKGKHIKTISRYFKGFESLDSFKRNPQNFDKKLMEVISLMIKEKKNG
jgi:uncharacterized protein with ParB-like and HNH nuclease domain